MEAVTKLYLIRHGEVEAKYHRVFGGRIDMELSPLGHEQVNALARFFQKIPIDVVFASPMKRVQQTMAPLVAQSHHRPVILQGLREVDFGAWTGLSWEEVKVRFNVSAFEWLVQLELGAIADAESTTDFRARIEECLAEILRAADGKSVAVVCHGGVIRMILAVLLDLPFNKMNGFDIEYASMTKVLYRPGKVEVELLNFTPWRDWNEK